MSTGRKSASSSSSSIRHRRHPPHLSLSSGGGEGGGGGDNASVTDVRRHVEHLKQELRDLIHLTTSGSSTHQNPQESNAGPLSIPGVQGELHKPKHQLNPSESSLYEALKTVVKNPSDPNITNLRRQLHTFHSNRMHEATLNIKWASQLDRAVVEFLKNSEQRTPT